MSDEAGGVEELASEAERLARMLEGYDRQDASSMERAAALLREQDRMLEMWAEEHGLAQQAHWDEQRLRIEAERKLEEERFHKNEWKASFHVIRQRLDEAERRLEEARAEVERVQMLPEQEWAEVTAAIMQEVAKVARAGHQPNAKAMQEALDAGKVYVVRLRAKLEEARQQRDGDVERAAQIAERDTRRAYEEVLAAYREALGVETPLEAVRRVASLRAAEARVEVLEAALRKMLLPPLILPSDDATEVAAWYDARARRALSPQTEEEA